MKKIILVFAITVVLILTLSSLAMANHKITIGYDLEGKYKTMDDDWWDDDDDSNTRIFDTEAGFTIGYECTYQVRRIEYGFGFESQLKRSLSDHKDADFKFSPLYGVIYVYLPHEEEETAPFFVGRLGYNMHTGNNSYKNFENQGEELDNGIYGAVGFGFNFNRSMGAILYSVNSGMRTSNAQPDFEDRYLIYSKFSIVYGFKF
jgi:hypothetical protein